MIDALEAKGFGPSATSWVAPEFWTHIHIIAGYRRILVMLNFLNGPFGFWERWVSMGQRIGSRPGSEEDIRAPQEMAAIELSVWNTHRVKQKNLPAIMVLVRPN